mgnify:FL=1
MNRRAFLKLAALLALVPLLPRVAFADTAYWQIGVSRLGIDTRLAPPASLPVPVTYRLWVPYAVQ